MVMLLALLERVPLPQVPPIATPVPVVPLIAMGPLDAES